jgi:hypothetical protein
MPSPGRGALERVRSICLALPGTTERLSHGTPTFFVGAKQFAQYWNDHHSDDREALWCAAPVGMQRMRVRADPKRFFVPPYVGHRGWLGVRLDRRPRWADIEGIIEEAHACVAPRTRV